MSVAATVAVVTATPRTPGLAVTVPDLSMLALVLGGSVLVGCTIVMSRAIPELFVSRRRPLRETQMVARPTARLAVTGRRPTLHTVPPPHVDPPSDAPPSTPITVTSVPAPSRQLGPASDDPRRDEMRTHDTTIDDPLIADLLAMDPAVLARIIGDWVRSGSDEDLR